MNDLDFFKKCTDLSFACLRKNINFEFQFASDDDCNKFILQENGFDCSITTCQSWKSCESDLEKIERKITESWMKND